MAMGEDRVGDREAAESLQSGMAGEVGGLYKEKGEDARTVGGVDEIFGEIALDAKARMGPFVEGFSAGGMDQRQGAAVPDVPSSSHTQKAEVEGVQQNRQARRLHDRHGKCALDCRR
jgi:hypothetical protein